jgi:hypothetical protein
MEPIMARPFKVYPDPHPVQLRRICLAQVIVSLSALTSTAVLLSKLLPGIMSGLN